MKKAGGLASNPLADSPFFAIPKQTNDESSLLLTSPPLAESVSPLPNPVAPLPITKKLKRKKETLPPVQPRNRDTTIPRYDETTVSRYHDTVVSLVRKAVKEFGKEAATHRFTAEEKKKIADLIYTYKMRGVKTSENEITRIAINFMVEDYRENGENSILDKVLRALNE